MKFEGIKGVDTLVQDYTESEMQLETMIRTKIPKMP